ncbi:MAG TPA: M50 family metallopeptidase, partial [Solirubrobacteraceae bacterium]|nr:M50 family metallopeptidase [Solirubrobacteraceae bacterium]
VELHEAQASLDGDPSGPGMEAMSAERTGAMHASQARVDELNAEVTRIKARAYYNQPVWKRVVVILAGPAVNLLIAFIIMAVLFASNGQYVFHKGQPVATKSVAGQLIAPASSYLKDGDKIVAVDGHDNLSVTQIQKAIEAHRCAGKLVDGCRARTPVTITVLRSGHMLTFSIYPLYNAAAKRMRVGFAFGNEIQNVGAVTAAGQSVSQLWSWTTTTVSHIAKIFEPKDRKQIHSVVGAFTITQEEFAFSATQAFEVLALISLSLAVINLFPFLPLDGGHVFWAVAEKVRGRRISFATMERAGVIGFAVIILIFVIGLSNDISTLSGSGFNVR